MGVLGSAGETSGCGRGWHTSQEPLMPIVAMERRPEHREPRTRGFYRLQDMSRYWQMKQCRLLG